MIRSVHGELETYSFSIFSGHRIQAEVVSRKGGRSVAPWDSMNLGGTVGDAPEHVAANKRLLWNVFKIDPGNVFDVWQVHSADFVQASLGRQAGEDLQKADIIVTDQMGLTLLMRFADCVPLVIYDPSHHACGIAHAGWQGTLQNVAGKMVQAMRERFGSDPGSCLAGIGPAICKSHYPVGREVLDQFLAHPEWLADGQVDTGGSLLDLKGINAVQLQLAGVDQVEDSGQCTACCPDLWYSHRRDQGRTGRFGAFITLENI